MHLLILGIVSFGIQTKRTTTDENGNANEIYLKCGKKDVPGVYTKGTVKLGVKILTVYFSIRVRSLDLRRNGKRSFLTFEQINIIKQINLFLVFSSGF